MSEILTTAGRSVAHFHLGQPPMPNNDLTAAEKAQMNQLVRNEFPGAILEAEPTLEFNCHGFGYAAAHGWFNSPRKFQLDDYILIEFEDVRVGDVVSYFNDGTLMHSAIVEELSGGQISKLRSKWGKQATVRHGLREVPADYGHPTRPRRRNPPQPA
jgi:hypothetical protein